MHAINRQMNTLFISDRRIMLKMTRYNCRHRQRATESLVPANLAAIC
jgi:hypothetical protein